MRRRNFMAMLASAAGAASSLARAQQKRMPRVAVMLGTGAAEGQGLVKAFESAWPVVVPVTLLTRADAVID